MPIVGDGDTGFGGVANVRRTVFEYHRAGFAAVTVEDQVFPKRCAFAAGMRVVSRRDALARLAAALGARDDIRAAGGDILVVGRTDCRLAANVVRARDLAMPFPKTVPETVPKTVCGSDSTAESRLKERIFFRTHTWTDKVVHAHRVD